MKIKCKIKGIDCANCAAELERKIQKIEGVDEASISFMTEKMIVECKEELKEKVLEDIRKTVKREEPDAIMTLI